jgi:hypothetical protein
MLNDAQREFLGHETIRAWRAKEIFGDNVTMEVQRAWEHPSGVILHGKYDGDFDKTNPACTADPHQLLCSQGRQDRPVDHSSQQDDLATGAGLTADIQKEGSHHE